MLRYFKFWLGDSSAPENPLRAGWEALSRQEFEIAESVATRCATDPHRMLEASRLLAQIKVRLNRLDQAEQILKSALEHEWDDQVSRELIECQLALGHVEDAIRWFRCAVENNPNNMSACLGLGTLLHAAGHDADVLHILKPVMSKLEAAPQLATAAYQLLILAGHASDARALVDRVARNPECPPQLLRIHLEQVAMALGESTAIRLGQGYVAMYPRDAELRTALAQLLLKAGDLNAAAESADLAAGMAAGNVEVLSACAAVQKDAGKLETARDDLELAIHFQPQNVSLWVRLVTLLCEAPWPDAAAEAASRFLRVHPAHAEAWFWQGKAADLCGRIEDAVAAYEHSIAINPDWTPSLTNLGLLRIEQGAADEALTHLKRVLALRPDDADAQLNIGMAYRFAANTQLALKHMTKALELSPDDPVVIYQLSTLRLATGDFSAGWFHYAARWLQPHAPRRRTGAPSWAGQPMDGKRVLLWGEQGLGDQVMFASCLEDARRVAGECVVECSPRLVSLFKRSFPSCEVIATEAFEHADAKPANFAAQAPLGDLPGFFRNSRSDFPSHQGYLKADASSALAWRERLAELPGHWKVGISWVGGVRQTGRARRSHDLLSWSPILSIDNTSFVSLQYTKCADELADVTSSLGIPIAHWQDAIDDLDQTAALLSELDLVITVCNTVVHLAGALNVPVWVMTPLAPEWRYMTSGTSLPWYPSATLFRQSESNQWGGVVAEIAARLKSLTLRQHDDAGPTSPK